jgi:hypothetical protein
MGEGCLVTISECRFLSAILHVPPAWVSRIAIICQLPYAVNAGMLEKYQIENFHYPPIKLFLATTVWRISPCCEYFLNFRRRSSDGRHVFFAHHVSLA